MKVCTHGEQYTVVSDDDDMLRNAKKARTIVTLALKEDVEQQSSAPQ